VSEILPPPHESLPSSSRYNFWKYKYPYPRLGRLATSAPNSALASPAIPVLPLAPEEDGQVPKTLSDKGKESAATTTASSVTYSGPKITPSALVICCLLSLLLGSLLRSLLSEADYVVYVPVGQEHPSGGEWRELKRLAEWQMGWGRDLVIAIARR
jgi:hypothetical protein